VRRLLGAILIASSVGCAAARPEDDAARTIRVRVVAKGERAEELRVRLERLLIEDPRIRVGDGGVHLDADLDLVRCQLMVGGGWGVQWGVRLDTAGPPPVEDDCLNALLPAVAPLTRKRLHYLVSRDPSPARSTAPRAP
jgi:hypothetical protein